MSTLAMKDSRIILEESKPAVKEGIRTRDELNDEEREIVGILDSLKNSLTELHDQYRFLTDPALIDGCAYEILSVNAKFAYYLNRCKEKKIHAI
jgi:predicted Zn-ribbon and HTH transcriptional regulator